MRAQDDSAMEGRGAELLAEHDRLMSDRDALRVWLLGLDHEDSYALAYELGKRLLDQVTEKDRQKRQKKGPRI